MKLSALWVIDSGSTTGLRRYETLSTLSYRLWIHHGTQKIWNSPTDCLRNEIATLFCEIRICKEQMSLRWTEVGTSGRPITRPDYKGSEQFDFTNINVKTASEELLNNVRISFLLYIYLFLIHLFLSYMFYLFLIYFLLILSHAVCFSYSFIS